MTFEYSNHRVYNWLIVACKRDVCGLCQYCQLFDQNFVYKITKTIWKTNKLAWMAWRPERLFSQMSAKWNIARCWPRHIAVFGIRSFKDSRHRSTIARSSSQMSWWFFVILLTTNELKRKLDNVFCSKYKHIVNSTPTTRLCITAANRRTSHWWQHIKLEFAL